jgi:hypothetical protein
VWFLTSGAESGAVCGEVAGRWVRFVPFLVSGIWPCALNRR